MQEETHNPGYGAQEPNDAPDPWGTPWGSAPPPGTAEQASSGEVVEDASAAGLWGSEVADAPAANLWGGDVADIPSPTDWWNTFEVSPSVSEPIAKNVLEGLFGDNGPSETEEVVSEPTDFHDDPWTRDQAEVAAPGASGAGEDEINPIEPLPEQQAEGEISCEWDPYIDDDYGSF